MAKIYETKADLEREQLSKELREKRNYFNEDVNVGVLSAALSMTSLQLDKLQKFEAETLNETRRWWDRANKPFGWAFGALAGLSFVAAFSARSKAKALEAKLDALGPEQIVLPEGVEEAQGHNAKTYARRAAKTPLEHAEQASCYHQHDR